MRRFLALFFPILLAILLVSRGAEWWSEKWWFGALDQGATWLTYMEWRAAAFALAAPLWLAIVGGNMRLAWRQALALREPLSLLGGGAGIAIALTPALRLGRLLARATVWLSAWLAALAAANRFDLWLLFRHSGADSSELGFFLFQLPALEWLVGWLGLAFGLTFLACLTLYFWLEAIETGPGVLRASESARRHLCFLGALLIAWKGMDCALNVVAARVVFGESPNGILGVPEQLAGLPTNQWFAWSALPVAVAVFWLGARDNGRRALALSAGWLCIAALFPAIAPAFARSLGVGDAARESQIIAAHLQSTRRAWGFDGATDVEIANSSKFVETLLPAPDASAPDANTPVANTPSASATDANATEARAPNANAPDASAGDANAPDANATDANATDANATDANATDANAPVAGAAKGNATEGRATNASAPVALWPIEGAARGLDEQLRGTSLRAARLHVVREGDALQLRAIATRRDLIGEAPARQWQAPVGTDGALRWSPPQTLDSVVLSEALPAPDAQSNRLGPAPPTDERARWDPLPRYRLTTQSRYGIERSFFGACFVLAWRFFDLSLATPGPPITMHLEPVERAQNLAPFVNWSGAVAHPVVLESGVGPHVYWIVEGCFSARTYPNSATLPGGELWAGINYASQNVTAVFDATTGESNLYLFNRTEPLARAWSRALPGLFRPIEEMPPAVRAAIRPSPARLNALARIYARYHRAPGDEALNWANRTSEWRPILSVDGAATPNWNDALLPTARAQGGLTQWQLGAFAPARGTVATGEPVASLTGVVGVTLAPDGRWIWRQWRPAEPLPLPEFATQPLFIINRETGARSAPPTRVGVFPAFGSLVTPGRADGFTAFRAELQPAKDGAPALLKLQAATTGALAESPAQARPIANSLNRARELWSAILTARRAADWPLVARLEAQLGRALDVPAPAEPAPDVSAPDVPAPDVPAPAKVGERTLESAEQGKAD